MYLIPAGIKFSHASAELDDCADLSWLWSKNIRTISSYTAVAVLDLGMTNASRSLRMPVIARGVNLLAGGLGSTKDSVINAQQFKLKRPPTHPC
jgi:hypothetical protein